MGPRNPRSRATLAQLVRLFFDRKKIVKIFILANKGACYKEISAKKINEKLTVNY